MTKLLTDLSYARPMNTYVGQPVEEIKALNAELDNRYKTNRADADKLELLAFNTKVLDKDNHIKDKAFNDINSGLSDYDYGNDWENADEKVRNLAKDFATNEALGLAKQNKITRDTGVKELQTAVKQGKIPKDWMNYEILKADQSYNGVNKNEETGVFEGSYNINRPADYIDIGNKMWEYAKDVKEGKEPLYLTQSDGTRKYIIHTEKGYIYEGDETKVSPQKIQAALRGMIMNNPEYKNQIKYENDILKFNLTRTGLKDLPNRPLNKNDIENLKYNNVLNDEDIRIALSQYGENLTIEDIEKEGNLEGFFDSLMYGKKIDSYINPASIGQSYSKIDIKSKKDWMLEDSLTYQRKKADELKKINEDKQTLILSSYGTKIYDSTNLNSEVAPNGKLGIENEMSDLNSTIKSTEKQIVNNYKILDNEKATLEEKELAKRSNEDLLNRLYLNKNRLDYLNEVNTTQYYKYLYENNKISKDDYQELTTGNSTRLKSLNDSRRKLKDITNNKVNLRLHEYSPKRDYSLDELEKMIKDSNKKGLSKLISKVKFNNEEVNKEWQNWVSKLTYERNVEDKIFNNKAKKEYLDKIKDQAFAPATFDFSTNVKNPEKLSYISQTFSNHIKRNKNAYILYGQDGKQTNLDSEDSPYYNQNEIEVTGMTDYVPGQGYMLKGNVKLQKESSKSGKLEYTGEIHEILLKPREGNQEARLMLQEALRKDYARWDKSNSNAKYGNGIEFADAILRDEIEAQSDKFRKTKLYEGEEQRNTYFLGENLNANVVKKVVNGKEFYSVYLEKYDTKRTMIADSFEDTNDIENYEAVGKAEKIVYNDLVSLENALEEIYNKHNNLTQSNIDKSIPRSKRNNNPLAMTTDVAKSLGFKEGVDYFDKGDTFNSKNSTKTYTTATFNSNINPVQTIINKFDELAVSNDKNIFTTNDGSTPRWSYLKDMFGKVFTNEDWRNMTDAEKYNVIKQMSIREGGGNLFNL